MDICSSCSKVSSWFSNQPTMLAYDSEGMQDAPAQIGQFEMAQRDLNCELCHFLSTLASEAANRAALPGAACFGMYSLHKSRLSLAFFAATQRPRFLEEDPDVFYIAPLFSSGSKARDWALRYNSFFMTLCGAEPKSATFARELLPRARLDVVRQWVQTCNRSHTHTDCNSCGRAVSDSELTIIDCEARGLAVLPAHSPYVTLSYVWGKEQVPVPFNDGRLPEGLPQLIEDAMAVTVSLGYRFLWVDRYCINELNKTTLIRTMDRIYSESSLTIIASASGEPSQGLMGVGRDRAQLPLTVHLEGLSLSHISTGLAREVEQSKWNTRAWTYQESFLSNRRLVFTQSQCYFECGELGCTEGLQIPLHKLAGLSSDQCLVERVFPWVADKLPPTLSGPCSRREQAEAYFVERVREYMKRELTYESDAFDAFAGALNYLENFVGEFLLGHILALPVWSSGSRWSTVGCAHEALLYSLTWSLYRPCAEGTDGVQAEAWHLSPNVDRSYRSYRSYRSFLEKMSAQRRREFPSWTWCGWKFPTRSSGKIGWRQIPTTNSVTLPVPVELSVEHEGNDVVPWPRLSNPTILLANANGKPKPRYIRARGILSDLIVPAHCWYANYDGECQCGPYRLKRRDVQYLSTAAGQRGLESTERGGFVLVAWFCHALQFNPEADNCRTEVMVLVPTAKADTYERLEFMCEVKMEYFLSRPSVEAMAQRFSWQHANFRIA